MVCEEDTIILGVLKTMDEANLTTVLVILTLTQAEPSYPLTDAVKLDARCPIYYGVLYSTIAVETYTEITLFA